MKQQITRLKKHHGVTVKDLAGLFGVTERAVYAMKLKPVNVLCFYYIEWWLGEGRDFESLRRFFKNDRP